MFVLKAKVYLKLNSCLKEVTKMFFFSLKYDDLKYQDISS